MGKAEKLRQDKARAAARADERRRVVLRVFQGCDESGARTLAQLAQRGVVPSCTTGCSHCCSLEIPVSRAEAEALATWLQEHITPAELEQIRERLRSWLVWYRTELPRLEARGMDRTEAFFRHAPKCSLLVDNQCSAYPVRPTTCRNHYVSSPVAECDPATGTGEPTLIMDVAKASATYVVELRRVVESQGGNYMATIHHIAEWLAHLLEVEREPWLTTSGR